MIAQAAHLTRDLAGLLARAALLLARPLWALWGVLQIDPLDWSLFTLIIVTQRWESVGIFFIQFLARRVPFVACGLAGIAHLPLDNVWTWRLLPGVYWIMSRDGLVDDDTDDEEDAPKTPESPEKRNGETAGNAIAMGKHEGNDPFHFPDLFTGMARLIREKKVTETEALKIVCQVNPGKSPRYAAARDRLHAALAALDPGPQFAGLDEEHRAVGLAPKG